MPSNIIFDILAKDNASAVVGKVTDKFADQERALKGLRVAGTAQFVALVAGAGLLAKASIDAGRDLVETANMASVVFGQQADEMNAWADTAANTVGLSKQAALQATATFGDMFSQLQFTGDQAASMSQSTVQLAADLGSFRNLPTEDVLLRIQAAMRGEFDSLKLLVPNISAARVETEALAQSGKTSAASLTAQEKVAATLAIIQRDTSNATGDFARTSGDLANQQKILKATSENMSAELGTHLLPVVLQVTSAGLEAMNWMENHQTATAALAVTVGTLSATIAIAANWQSIITTKNTLAAGAQWLWNTATGAGNIVSAESVRLKVANATATATSTVAIGALTATTAASTAVTAANAQAIAASTVANKANASSLSNLTKAAGPVVAALAFMAVGAPAMQKWGLDTAVGTGEATKALVDLANGADIADTSLGKMLDRGGVKDWFTGNDVDNIERAYKVLKDSSVDDQVDNVLSSVLSLGQSTSTSRMQSEELFKSLDEGLASLAQSGDTDTAAQALKNLGLKYEDVKDLLPSYTDALAAADVQHQLTSDSAVTLTESEDNLKLAQEEAAKALDKWRESASSADQAFLDLTSAFDAVIDKNTAFAKSTADSTTSADDSWETYYDGQSVSADDYIAQLQAQVDAQTNWETNMVTVAERVSTGMSGSMKTAANAMIDELMKLGPEGANQVALLSSMSDEQFSSVVTLWQEKGTESVAAFTTQVESYRQPMVTPNVNVVPAQTTFDAWLAQSRTASVTIKATMAANTLHFAMGPGGSGGLTFAGGGRVRGPGTSTSDSIPAWLSNDEFVHTAAAHEFWGTPAMDALNNMNVTGLFAALSAEGLAGGGSPTGLSFTGTAGSIPYQGLTEAGRAVTASAASYTLNFIDADGVLLGTMRGVAAGQAMDAQNIVRTSSRRV